MAGPLNLTTINAQNAVLGFGVHGFVDSHIGGRIQVPVSESDGARVVQLLLLDVKATLGPAHEAIVLDNAARVAAFADDPVWYRDKLVEDVQQYFHDCFVDTTWPTCPRHSKHPLWFHGEYWYCERDGEVIARLGELHSIRGRAAAHQEGPST